MRRTGSTNLGALCVLAVAGALLGGSCGVQVAPSPPAIASPAPTSTPGPTLAYADRLRIGRAGIELGFYRRWQPALELMGVPALTFGRLVYSGLYGSTYDQADRARLLREAQEELAAQLPAIFLWVDTGTDGVRSAVATVDGPLDLTVPNWAWQPERMVVEEAAP